MDGRTNRRVRRTRAGRRLTPALAPSDLSRAPPRAGAAIRVGGRVSLVDKTGIRLSDALGSVVVRLRQPAAAEPGDLLLISGIFRGKRVVEAAIVARRSAPVSRGDGEHARLAWSGAGPRLERRARALAVIREYFAEQAFVEVDTPLRVRTPGLDVHIDALRAEGGYLVTSPEFQMKRLLVGGMPRIYQLAHCFRDDELGLLHEPEFMMLEWYRAFAEYEAILGDTEQVVTRVVTALAGKPFVNLPSGKRVDVRPPFERLSVSDAFRRYASGADAVDLSESAPERFFELLVDRVEPALARHKKPVFLTDYPISQASLARPKPGEPRLAERFELYLGPVELSNGFGELTDAVTQRQRFANDRRERRALGRPVYRLDERFLDALVEGMPESSGNALGVDRLIALALGVTNIADVMAIPSARL